MDGWIMAGRTERKEGRGEPGGRKKERKEGKERGRKKKRKVRL